jgi:hypothetical protein
MSYASSDSGYTTAQPGGYYATGEGEYDYSYGQALQIQPHTQTAALDSVSSTDPLDERLPNPNLDTGYSYDYFEAAVGLVSSSSIGTF